MQTDSKFGCAKYTLGTNILIKILNFFFLFFPWRMDQLTLQSLLLLYQLLPGEVWMKN